MVHNISKPYSHKNMVLKLDLYKSYNRVSWDFLCKIHRYFGFSERWFDMIWRLISNVWYSINFNGTRHDFFSSTRG